MCDYNMQADVYEDIDTDTIDWIMRTSLVINPLNCYKQISSIGVDSYVDYIKYY